MRVRRRKDEDSTVSLVPIRDGACWCQPRPGTCRHFRAHRTLDEAIGGDRVAGHRRGGLGFCAGEIQAQSGGFYPGRRCCARHGYPAPGGAARRALGRHHRRSGIGRVFDDGHRFRQSGRPGESSRSVLTARPEPRYDRQVCPVHPGVCRRQRRIRRPKSARQRPQVSPRCGCQVSFSEERGRVMQSPVRRA